MQTVRFIHRRLLLAALAIVVAAGCEDQPKRKPRPPRTPLKNKTDIDHVILISIDTLRADHLACYGHPFVQSPNINQLAAEGVLFTRHVSAAPTTLASHTSLMTGTYPHTHGIPKNGYVVNEENVMLAEMLKEGSFATAAFVGAFPLDAQFRFDQGFDHFDAKFDLARETHVRDWAQRRAETVTDAVLQWLDTAKAGHDQRLFLFVHYFDVHWPYEAPPPHRGMYRRDSLSSDGSMPEIQQAQKLLRDPATREEGLRRTRALDAEYCAEITYCDYQIGRLFQGLKNRRLFDNSLIVLTSDHGETMHEHSNVFNHGISVYETEIHIPLIMRFPGGRFGGRRVDRLCSNVDLVPTLLHLLDLPDNDRVEGESFAGVIDGPLPPRGAVFAEATQPWTVPKFNDDPVWLNQTKFQCLRTERYKYASRLGDRRFEFYDLRSDPAEQVNLLTGGRRYDQVLFKRLRDQLEQWRAQARPLPSECLDSPEAIEKLRALGYVSNGNEDEDQ